MKKKILGTAVFATLVAVVAVGLRRFGPTLAERGMKKCHEMMGGMAHGCPPGQTGRATGEGQEDSGHVDLGEGQRRPMSATP